MEERRCSYIFLGFKANESAKYFDLVISHGYDGDMDNLAYEAAHKFGQRLMGKNMASFYNGILYGVRANEATIYIDQIRNEAYSSLPEFNRSKRIKEIMTEQYKFVCKENDVQIEIM